MRYEAMKIAVLLPCYCERPPIGEAGVDFRAALSEAEMYVYDNQMAEVRLPLFTTVAGHYKKLKSHIAYA